MRQDEKGEDDLNGETRRYGSGCEVDQCFGLRLSLSGTAVAGPGDGFANGLI